MTDQQQPQDKPSPHGSARIVDAVELFAGQNTVLIRHENEFYRLLRTKNGKLILQK